MEKDCKKFLEIIKKDEALQKKLEEAAKNYKGEQTEEAVFEQVIAPIAREADVSFTLDDLKQSVQELDSDEMEQVAGGWGQGGCGILGAGVGGAASKEEGFGLCFLIGAGIMGIKRD